MNIIDNLLRKHNIENSISPREILFLNVIGSRIYNFNTVDIDIKGFYVPLKNEKSKSICKYYFHKGETEYNIISIYNLSEVITTYTILDCFFSPKEFLWINNKYKVEVDELFKMRDKLSVINIRELYLSFMKSIHIEFKDGCFQNDKSLYYCILNSCILLNFYKNGFNSYRSNLYNNTELLNLLSDIKTKKERTSEGFKLFISNYEKILSLEQEFLLIKEKEYYLNDVYNIVESIINKKR